MITGDKLNEECAVFGVSQVEGGASGITYYGLLSLQHRGQEGAGIAAVVNGSIRHHKDTGLVSEVFAAGDFLDRTGNACSAVGHTRYSTTGGNTKENTGPFITEYLTGRIATAHNGNITNAREIRADLMRYGLRFNATSDSEVISSLIAHYITKEQDTYTGVLRAAEIMRGAFSLVILTGGNDLIAIRDATGYRPLCIGCNDSGFAVASESCALESCGFDFLRDVLPGEIAVFNNGQLIREGVQFTNKDPKRGLCIFEYVYFARPDSLIDGLSVYEARRNMGATLASEHPIEADCICGVPDSGLEAAFGYSLHSDIPLVSAFVKNRYIGRSFIYPTQSQRDIAVRLKLNPLAAAVKGKRVVLVDDSIVRGTTCERIIRSLKNAGAREVHMRVSSPPFHHACHYGTDIDSEENLIANNLSIEEIRKKIGADTLGYISIGGLMNACCECRLDFCSACFVSDGNQSKIKKDILE